MSLLSTGSYIGVLVVQNIVQEVRKTEEDAGSIVEEAERKKEKIIGQAEERASEIVEEAEQDAEKEKLERMNKFKDKVNDEREEIVGEGREEADELREKASKNFENAENFLKERFEKEFQ
ncbi:MAG: ATP synthase archaeal subunit H [Nanohaloarchaea archaeon SW_10_44_10]|nr:MAG: ATP synthase archaeal subunit H [Nanohaloarchaea archaeon SW_10_44_10]